MHWESLGNKDPFRDCLGRRRSLISLQCAMDHPSSANEEEEAATSQREGRRQLQGGGGKKERSEATTKVVKGREGTRARAMLSLTQGR